MAEAPEDSATPLDAAPPPAGWRQRWETTSLAFRLFLLATGWSLLALLLAGFVLLAWYRSTVERSFETLLDVYSLNLVASVDQSDTGQLSGTPNLGEPRFASYHSGWYWQVTVAGKPGLGMVSPSLAGGRLEMAPVSDAPYDRDFRRKAVIEGPAGRDLLAIERVVIFDASGDQLNFVMAGDLADVDAELAAFRVRLFAVFALLGIGLVTISVVQVRVGLMPLHRLGRALAAIREGRSTRLEGRYPGEIMPLVQGAEQPHRFERQDRRARAHACRQPGARAEDAAVGAPERGARRRRASRRQGRGAGAGDAPPARPLSRAGAHGRPLARARRGVRGAAGRRGAGPDDGADPRAATGSRSS